MTDLTASIINGAAQGNLLGSSLANAQNANDWKRAYGLLMKDYNNLVDKFDKLADMYKNIQARRDEYAEMVDDLNNSVSKLNSSLYSLAADRTKAYDYIVELTSAIRELDPGNKALSNPNSILSEVNFYSESKMREASNKITLELSSNTQSQFSKNNSKGRLDEEADKRKERALKYKNDADKGVVDVDRTISPGV